MFVIGKDGKVIGGNGPPGLAINPTKADSLTGKPILSLVGGDYPSGPNQVALDVDAAEKGDFKVGDTVELATPGQPPVMKAKLTGLVEFGSGGLNGATLTVFDNKFMQERFYGGRDVYSSVSLNAADGVSQTELANAAKKVLPAGVVARTGDAYVEENKASLDEVLGFLQTFLLVFAAVSLIVGFFIIINTFSILVAQRSRELALLRAMGASRRQVNRSVLLEAIGRGTARVDGRPGRRLPARARAALALRRVRAGPEPGRLPDDLVGRVPVVRRRRGRHGARCAAARAPRLADRSDGGPARRRGPARVDGAATRRDRHRAGAGRVPGRWQPGCVVTGRRHSQASAAASCSSSSASTS